VRFPNSSYVLLAAAGPVAALTAAPISDKAKSLPMPTYDAPQSTLMSLHRERLHSKDNCFHCALAVRLLRNIPSIDTSVARGPELGVRSTLIYTPGVA
jgi:hypothetical protein